MHLQDTVGTTSPTLFSLVRKEEQAEEEMLACEDDILRHGYSDPFSRFARDLVDLVLSVSDPSKTASDIQTFSRRTTRKAERINRCKVFKDIRCACIESRLPFWPGILKNG